MTDLQDLVLDALVGAEIGVNLPDSPLTVAARLLPGKRPLKFGGRTNDSAMSEIARRLGWPVILADAVQGGLRAVKDDEERRRFAMTVFRTLPVGGTQPKLSKPAQARVAAHTALAVHPLVCQDPECPWPARMAAVADAAEGAESGLRRGVGRCRTVEAIYPHRGFWNLSREVPKEVRFDGLNDHALTAFLNKPKTTAGYALREAVKLTVAERGIAEAVRLIADIARRCGLAVEAV